MFWYLRTGHNPTRASTAHGIVECSSVYTPLNVSIGLYSAKLYLGTL